MLNRLIRTAVMPLRQPVPNDSLRRACDAIMHSHEVLRAPAGGSLYRDDADVEPPAAATVELVFRREYPNSRRVEIPRGTRVSTSHGCPQTFLTGRTVCIEAGEDDVRVLAYHADLVDAELLGFMTGADLDRTWRLSHAPIVASTTSDLELMVGVSVDASELVESDRVTTFDGRLFVLWSEVGSVWAARTGGRLFVSDRRAGLVTPLPRLRRSAPDGTPALPIRREVRAWYWSGGGIAGNVPADSLSVVHNSLVGVVVTNPVAARGGRNAGHTWPPA